MIVGDADVHTGAGSTTVPFAATDWNEVPAEAEITTGYVPGIVPAGTDSVSVTTALCPGARVNAAGAKVEDHPAGIDAAIANVLGEQLAESVLVTVAVYGMEAPEVTVGFKGETARFGFASTHEVLPLPPYVTWTMRPLGLALGSDIFKPVYASVQVVPTARVAACQLGTDGFMLSTCVFIPVVPSS
jgi:hypothetical protein